MCGIVGAFDLSGGVQMDPTRIRAMTEAIRHRGPDGDGFYVSGPLGMGMRRLSIIDVAGGDQPIGNEDDTIQIVFNGEIYNYLELQSLLRARGHRLATRSDTETIVHLYEDHGLSVFEHLRGMYAFALWDSREQRLTLAIDHIGIKPLYVCQVGTILLFASEIKALFAYGPEVPRELNPAALDTYLTFGFMVGPETPFKGIRRLDPGTALVAEKGTVRTIQHWRMEYPHWVGKVDETLIVEQVRETLREAVKIHLRSDVPLGLFLSGGVDSASLLALMDTFTPGKINTYTVGYSDGDHPDNELEAARHSAQVFGSSHHELRLDAAQWWEYAAQYAYAHDEPNANPSAVSLLALSKLTAQTVKVVLNGIGSDEIFAGYPVHRELPKAMDQAKTLRRILPQVVRRGGRWSAEQLERTYPLMRRFRGVGAIPNLLPSRYHLLDDEDVHLWRTMAFDGTVFSDGLRQSLLQPNAQGAAQRAFMRLLDSAPTRSPANLIHYLKMYLWLPGNGLLSADKVSMAYSLEGRVPYFDRHLMSLCASIPAEVRLKENKYLLRASMEAILPPVIRDRPKKPFGTPIRTWFEGALQPQLKAILYDPAAARPYFERKTYLKLIDGHFSGRTSQTELIWRLAHLEMWHRAFWG